jgi:hypothetical protein
MGCSTCLQEKSKFYCNACVKESLFEYIGVKNNIVINIPNIKEIVQNHYTKKINQLRTNYLKEQIVQFKLQCCDLATNIADYKLKNKEVRSQNHERKLKIEKYKTTLNNLIKQSKSEKEFFISKIKEVETDTQVRTGYTRKGLVCQLRSMVYFCPVDSFVFQQPGKIAFCRNTAHDCRCNSKTHLNYSQRIQFNPLKIPEINAEFPPDGTINKKSSSHPKPTPQESYMQTRSLYFRFYFQFGGGVLHLIHIVNQISRYLGKLLPFSVVYQKSTPYIKHGFTHFQNISDIPLFLLDKIQDFHPLLVAISFYNLAYLCFTQSIVVTSEDFSEWATGSWSNHLQQLFKICQQRGIDFNVGLKRGADLGGGELNALNVLKTSEALDPAFKIEFKELLSLITNHLKGNRALANPRYTFIDKNLLDDYFIPDRDTSKAEDEPWDIVDVVLPPTPSELHAAGI